MGRDKRRLRLFPESPTFLERAVAIGRVVAGRVVVIGDHRSALATADAEFLPDRWPGEGPLGGLLSALRSFPTERLVVLASDYPMLQVELMATLLDRLDGWDATVAVDVGGRRHPLVAAYDAARCAEAASELFLNGERSMSTLLNRLSVRTVTRARIGIRGELDRLSLSNVNSVDDLETLRRSSLACNARVS